MLIIYNNIGSGWTSTITAIIGFILFFIGLGQLKPFMDELGEKGFMLLTNSAILGVIAMVIDFISLMGILAGIMYIIAFIKQLYGLMRHKHSTRIGSEGINGVSNLIVAMILVIVGSILGLIPAAGKILNAVISLIAFMLILFGWLKIQKGLLSRRH